MLEIGYNHMTLILDRVQKSILFVGIRYCTTVGGLHYVLHKKITLNVIFYSLLLRKHLDSVSEPRPTVHVSGVSSPTLETLLLFLHSGSITIKDDSEAREFISAAAFFGVKGFEEGTEQTQVGKDNSRLD